MHDYQREFIEFSLDHEVLRFGEFTLKSGRTSPYFFNAGLFNTGARLAELGAVLRRRDRRSGLEFDVLLGPAYKGIPHRLGDRGPAGRAARPRRAVVLQPQGGQGPRRGRPDRRLAARGRVLVVDDVITAGTAIREVMEHRRRRRRQGAGVIVAVDRQERGTGELSAIQEVERDFGVTSSRSSRSSQIIEYVEETGRHAEHLDAIRAYRDEYGIVARRMTRA